MNVSKSILNWGTSSKDTAEPPLEDRGLIENWDPRPRLGFTPFPWVDRVSLMISRPAMTLVSPSSFR